MKMQTMFFLAPLLLIAKPAHAQAGGRMSAMLDKADADHDGRITRAEFIDARKAMFDKLDRNHDGVVSQDDFGRLRRFRPKAADQLDAFIRGVDADHDGRVTQAELDSAPTTLFDLMDTNHDGAIDQAERAAAAARRKKGGA
jgi:Ca2+-binding EF-hand superfamily protein